MIFNDGERSYVLGLLISGGEISDVTFSILFPFDQWATDPKSQTEISTHILTKMRQTFKNAYGLDIEFSLGRKNRWTITPIGDLKSIKNGLELIRADLKTLGLPSHGVLLEMVDLTIARKNLSQASAIRFLAGICDVRASLTKSHRNRVDTTPIVSVEVPARTKNFAFVVQLCSWMTSIGNITDQVLYNHPSLQSSNDPYYLNWKKGFKIRIRAASFVKKLSFSISAKSFDAKELAKIESSSDQEPCRTRKIKPGFRTIHSDLNSSDLPEALRGHVFLHYHHLCAALGCPYAPLEEVKSLVGRYENLISVFPLCSKGEIEEISVKFNEINDSYFDVSLSHSQLTLFNVLALFSNQGYVELKNALAFLAAKEVKGKRHVGSQEKILQESKGMTFNISLIRSDVADEQAPLMVSNPLNNRAVIVSSITGNANKRILRDTVSVSGLTIRVK